MFDNIIEEHERICIQNTKVIVHDENYGKSIRFWRSAVSNKEILTIGLG